MSSCNNRVVVITGAGGGLGRAYALAFAAEGAKVVVNDINRDAAEAVVAQIREQDGQAIANSNDITHYEDAGRIVAAALEAFGGLDVVVNNAGICRDRMFVSLTEADWDDVMRVHLRGHFCLANLLARRWRDAAKAGRAVDARIINTSSGAGLQGSVGQSNYAAAKAGIAALTLNDIEGASTWYLLPWQSTPRVQPAQLGRSSTEQSFLVAGKQLLVHEREDGIQFEVIDVRR